MINGGRRLRTSERLAFARCRQLWWWAWQEGYRAKLPGPALRFGTLVHKALELRYPPGVKRGPHPATTFEQLYEEELKEAMGYGFRDEDGTWNDAGELGVALLTAFVDQFGKDEEWRVISSEQTFQVRLSQNIAGGHPLYYVGTLDGIWKHRSSSHIVVKEWKTTDQFWFKHLPLDEQAGSYWAFATPWLKRKKILKPEDDLKGILYTFLRKSMPDDRPVNAEGLALNKDGSVSKRQPSPLFHRELVFRDAYDRRMIRARTLAQAAEMEMIRRGQLAVWKSPGRFNCAGCPFIGPCELHETGADYKPLLRSHYEVYNPYSAHEVAEEGKN